MSLRQSFAAQCAPAVGVCLLVALGAGCASPEKPAVVQPPPRAPVAALRPQPPLSNAAKGPARRPEPTRSVARPLVYALRRALRRPPQTAGRLAVPLRRQWKYIVIHHSATDEGSAATFDRYQREQKGWRGIGYDFVIGNGHGSPDGLIEVTFRWEQQLVGAHAGLKEYNEQGVGICLVGDFDRNYPTPKQMEALVAVVNDLQERCRIPTGNIVMHRQIRPAGTHCPGKNFPFYDFLSMLDH